jgi:hypothetical protein
LLQDVPLGRKPKETVMNGIYQLVVYADDVEFIGRQYKDCKEIYGSCSAV